MKQLFFAPVLLASCLLCRDIQQPPPVGVKLADWTQILAEHERFRHAARADDAGHTSRNRGQQWRARFDGRGFEIAPDGKAWRWGLELTEFSGHPISGKAAAVRVDKNRVTYDWPAVQEWFLNDDRGLEHGFVIPARSGGPVELTFKVRGRLKSSADATGSAVTFADETGAAAMRYAGLKAWDADGKKLAASMRADGASVRLIVDDRGARYPITIDPVAQQAYLKPAAVGSTQAGDRFGYSVSISGDTIVVGARGEDSNSTGAAGSPNELAADAGAAFVYVRSNGVWTQQAYLKPTAVGGGQQFDFFGSSVAISGDIIVVGAPFEDSSTTGVNNGQNEGSADSGAAYVFVRTSGQWLQQAFLKPTLVGTTQQGDQFGYSVAVSGETVVVSAPFEAGSNLGVNSPANENATLAGAAYVFIRTGGVTWTQQAYLKPAFVGTSQANDGFGFSLSISGDTIAVGAPGESSSTTGVNSVADESSVNAGAAYVFTRSGTSWNQQAYLKPAATGGTQSRDLFGASVAISADTLVVGASYEDSSTIGVNTVANESGPDRGAAFIFVRNGATWTQQAYLKPAGNGSINYFGGASAISGNTVVVGADYSDTFGAAYVFVRNSGGFWIQDTELRPANGGSNQLEDAFAGSVSVSGDTVVAGAAGEDGSATGINNAVDENAFNSGAAFVFAGVGAAPSPLQFLPIAPCRLVDTRTAAGALGGPAIAANSSRNFPIRSGCGLPSSTTAYSLNITVVPRGSLGFLTIWPGGLSQPLVSTLNSLDGRIKANAAVVPAGVDGSVNVYVTDLADVIIDVNGVFVPQGSNSAGQAFYPVTPCRISDSRAAGGGGVLAAGATRNVIVANAAGCGIPVSATAYATNVTVVPRQPLGFLTLWPGGSGRPTVSTLNALTGTVTANLAIVPAGTAGDVNAFVTDSTDLIVDVTGYFGPPGAAGALNFYTLTPCRVVDTRNAAGDLGGPLPGAGSTREFPVRSSSCNVPANAQAYSMNATVLPQPALGFLTLYPSGLARPTVSTLNAVDGSLTANAAIVPAGSSGRISAFVSESAHLLLDINGYFAP